MTFSLWRYLHQKKLKQELNVAQGLLGNVGWWTSGVKSFEKLFKFIHGALGDLTDEQKHLMSEAANSISYFKTDINWICNIINAAYNVVQIRERLNDPNKRFGNVIRGLRIFGTLIFITFDIVLLIGVSSVVSPVLMLISSGLNVFIKIMNVIKNAHSQAIDIKILDNKLKFEQKYPEQSPEALKQKNEVNFWKYRIYLRKARITSRSISLCFALISLGIVILATVSANPMFFAGLVVCGISNLLVSKLVRFLRNEYLNKYREELDMKPKLHYLRSSVLVEYINKLRVQMAKEPKDCEKYQELKTELRGASLQLALNRWNNLLFATDMTIGAGMAGFASCAIVMSNPLIFIGVGVMAVVFVGSKIGLHFLKVTSLAKRFPHEYGQEASTDEMDEQMQATTSACIDESNGTNEKNEAERFVEDEKQRKTNHRKEFPDNDPCNGTNPLSAVRFNFNLNLGSGVHTASNTMLESRDDKQSDSSNTVFTPSPTDQPGRGKF